ncbi:MAG: zinc-ribbon domain-containing protein [Myxococcota bacterium]|nr:zinc-ribbon domain-containing protein [Myxococcota bacterium]
MNFACENCQRRYTIADEKVRDRPVRIRCKACQHLMSVGPLPAPEPQAYEEEEKEDATRMVSLESLEVLRVQTMSPAVAAPAPAPAANPWEDEPTRAAPSGEDGALWFVSSGGKQLGPFATAELVAKLRSGAVQARNFVWKKGMTDWKRASDLPELAGLLEEPAAAARFVPPPVAGSIRSAPTQAADDGGLFGTPGDLGQGLDYDSPAASPQRDLDARDLFADLELSRVVQAPAGLQMDDPYSPGQHGSEQEHEEPQASATGEHFSDPRQDEEEDAPRPSAARSTDVRPAHRGTFAMSAGTPGSVWKSLLAFLLVLIALAAGLATAIHERLIEVPPEIQEPIDQHWPVPARTQAPAPVRPPPVAPMAPAAPPAQPAAAPAPAAPDGKATPSPPAEDGR